MTAARPCLKDIAALKRTLNSLPTQWDGREAILEMKNRNGQWRQMEWIGFYFELLCHDRIAAPLQTPGARYENVQFDIKGSINWDMKASAIKADRHVAILNDVRATDASIADGNEHGVIIALVDVDYNDLERTFQQWHTTLKGGASKYEQDRIARNAISRYRKTAAYLRQILFLAITEQNKDDLSIHRQGRNANGAPRNPKYAIDIEQADVFEVDRINFAK